MEDNTNARYFFPSNSKRLKATVWSPLVTMHRRQISQQLAARVKEAQKSHHSHYSTDKISKTIQSERLKTHNRNITDKISKTIQSERLKTNSRNTMEIISKTIKSERLRDPSNKTKNKRYDSKVIPNRLTTQNIGLKNLLQKAMRLKTQEISLKGNPFYKIQKKRNSLWKSHRLGLSQKIQHLQHTFNQQPREQLFQNRSLWSFNDEFSSKLRSKSQTVTYYQIKNYYESKYGRQPILPV